MKTVRGCGYAAIARSETLPEDTIEPLDPEVYATASITEAFDWQKIIQDLNLSGSGSTEYLVAFRSQLRQDANTAELTQRDESAHMRAMGVEGYIAYFAGEPNSDGQALSFCIWEDQAAADRGASGAEYREAMKVVREMYETYELERYKLTIPDDVEAAPSVVALQDGEAV